MNEPKPRHSPLPWKVVTDRFGDTSIQDAEGGTVCCNTSYYPTPVDENDMEFIVEIINKWYETRLDK